MVVATNPWARELGRVPNEKAKTHDQHHTSECIEGRTEAASEPIRKLWTADETAEWLGVSKRGLYRLVREGRLPVVNVGRYYRFNPVELARWLEGGGRT